MTLDQHLDRCMLATSLRQRSKNAFAIGCILPKQSYLKMTLACAASIRSHGHKEDIVILTADRKVKELLGHRFRVRVISPISYQALKYSISKEQNWCDAQKMFYWSLTEYDKIIALDADVMLIKNCEPVWLMPSLTAPHACEWCPLQTSIMVLEPNQQDFEVLRDLCLRSDFDPMSGWDRIGPFPHWLHDCLSSNWDFQAAEAAQGFVFYYFNMVKKTYQVDSAFQLFEYFKHFWGKRKLNDEHNSLIARCLRVL